MYDEFSLFKYSVDIFNNDVFWFIACDNFTYHKISGMKNAKLFPIISREGTHLNIAGQKNDKGFYEIILTKMKVCIESIKECGYAFFLDSDMLFVDQVELREFVDSDVDVFATPHHENAPANIGRYNVGTLIIKDIDFVNRWREETEKRNSFYEQKPFEKVVLLSNLKIQELPLQYNVTGWKCDCIGINGSKNMWNYISTDPQGFLTLDGKRIKNLHFHSFIYGKNPPNPTAKRYYNLFWGKIENSQNNKYVKIFKEYNRIMKGKK
jgi:hypothetical protein